MTLSILQLRTILNVNYCFQTEPTLGSVGTYLLRSDTNKIMEQRLLIILSQLHGAMFHKHSNLIGDPSERPTNMRATGNGWETGHSQNPFTGRIYSQFTGTWCYIQEILEEYDGLSIEDFQACLLFATTYRERLPDRCVVVSESQVRFR